MSRQHRSQRVTGGGMLGNARPVTTLRGPGDAIAIIPYLLGFTPHESLVVVALEGRRKRLGPSFRMDLVRNTAAVDDQAGFVRELVRHHHFDPVMVFAFSERHELAERVLLATSAELSAGGVGVLDAIRVTGTRWWSTTCRDPLCCSPAGTPYDIDTSRVAAEAVWAGLQRAPDRESLRAQFAPHSSQRLAAVADAAATVEPCADVTAQVGAALGRQDTLSVVQIAELAVTVQDIGNRDQAWSLMTRTTAERHFDLWREVMRSVPDALLPPVGALAAFAAWLSGHGVLASHAADRVLAVDNSYSMARLVIEALQASLNPNSWDALHSRGGSGSRVDAGP